MTCTDFLSKLTDYFDGQISPELLEEVRAHSAGCHHCEVVLDTTRQTIEVYRDHQHFELSVELQERLHTAIMMRFRERVSRQGCGPRTAAPAAADVNKAR